MLGPLNGNPMDKKTLKEEHRELNRLGRELGKQSQSPGDGIRELMRQIKGVSYKGPVDKAQALKQRVDILEKSQKNWKRLCWFLALVIGSLAYVALHSLSLF